ncbi:hypothetical protein [Paenibacillus dakarensis]|uniref:hypothetical protein n=1 Tax=Paenibacillus dakarensis TaxID=1527293 RepID=UPI0006D56C77|nr:hypothetical protein [Paenibacillus dakarensis]
MAKKREEVENRILTPIYPFRQKEVKHEPTYTRCGCGKPAIYEVYEDHQPHCRSCMLEAVDCNIFTPVRRLEGGYDDAS